MRNTSRKRSNTRRTSESDWRTKLLRGIGYVVAFALLLALDNAVESIGGTDHLSIEQRYAKIFSPSALYPRLTGAGSKSGKAQHTVVITIGREETKELLDDPCAVRRLVAHLIKALQDVRPSALAIDRSFNLTGCGSEVTNSLLRTELMSSRIPIVLGQATQSFDDLQTKWPLVFANLLTHGFSEDDLLVADPVPFSDVQPGKVMVGLMRLDADNRKIPMSWHVRNADGSSQWLDTLASVAVKLAKPDENVHKRILGLQQRHRNPLSSFYREEQLPLISALDVICTNKTTAPSWPLCKQRNTGAVDFSSLQGRVLVIGIVDPNGREDVQESPVGKVSGVILQANYVEALFANSFLSAVSPATQIAVGIAWFVIVELILRACRGSILRSIGYPLLVIALLWFSISVLLLFFRVYVELLFPSILVIIVAHVSKRVEKTIQPEAGD